MMKHSLSYYLTISVLKLKGIKKQFSKSPIDYKALRKDDVYAPKGSYFKSFVTNKFTLGETKITEINRDENSQNLLIYIHGGAFVFGPSKHHWDSLKTISQKTDFTIWMCDYPKAPENKIIKINNNIDLVYEAAIEKFNPKNIVFVGDSAGATLILLLMQRLVKKNQEKPARIILISPVLDASLDNPKVEEIDPKDPMLSKVGAVSAKLMCLEDNNLKSEIVSPLYGSFLGFPKTDLFIGDHDIAFPDEVLFAEKLKEAQVPHTVFIGEGMPHIWPLLPVMSEAKQALNQIIKILSNFKS